MAGNERFEGSIRRWLEETAPDRLPQRVLTATFERTRRSRQGHDWRGVLGRPRMPRLIPALVGAAVIVVATALTLNVVPLFGPGASPSPDRGTESPSPAPQQSVDLGIFTPVAGRIVYGGGNGIRGVDPAAPTDPATVVELTGETGIPLGWSSNGTQLLILRGDLFALHADGSEEQLTKDAMQINGATISPDGSRVVFAGGTGHVPGGAEGECCAQFGLFAVDADGGPHEMNAERGDGIIDGATFSPDGRRIAYVDGAGDNGHRVWVMDADGSNAHQIVANDVTLGAGHVRGLAWSPAGNRIALGLAGWIYTFAADGSDFTPIAGGDGACESAESCAVNLPRMAISPYWSPDGSQIAYMTGCVNGPGVVPMMGCHLAIADADGSNVREFRYGMPGPWHPGTRF